jgi:hypothetical protein
MRRKIGKKEEKNMDLYKIICKKVTNHSLILSIYFIDDHRSSDERAIITSQFFMNESKQPLNPALLLLLLRS